MPVIYIFLSFLISLLLETTLFNRLAIYGAKPDFVLILVVLVAVKKGSMTGQLYGFIGGLMQDGLSYGVLGVQAMVKTITGFGSGYLKNKLEENSLLLIMILVFLITIFSGFLGALARAFFTSYIFLSHEAVRIVISAGYNALLSPLVALVVKKIYPANK
ncbi:MAG: rod shape-determining protein MreD [bacterium]|nr:rod shape-determining protein MreD [bacterium]MDD5354049.1 rod shape-determining protein MreD [bacterium]MDD5756108.1 rod shape-determining protein MreD [bacterium]